ncbi:MAG TPA: acyltransferase family protein [Mycobacterium sp.]|nr:acyltransferase family protein [Mycobacterium sp.]
MRREDLDGLRGVAIALVAMFHVWFGRVSGGVDVFLVLSGFFFGGRVLRATLADRMSPALEIARLVRRLLPALVVVLAASAVLTVLIQPQTRWETFAQQSLASLGYFQNWQLAWSASDYLRAGEAVSPLQHIWSMSVQGQFFLAFLALIWAFAARFRSVFGRHLRVALVMLVATLTLASFVFAVFAHAAEASSAYYDSFARAWELLAGVLVGALVGYVTWPMWLRTTLAGVALAAICCCGVLIDGVKEFPGPAALVPVGATVLIILAGANRTPAPNRLLAAAPLVALGAMAYSLYLWHWPLLIFWLAFSGHRSAGVVDGAAVLAISGLLAYLTTRYVENPLRFTPALRFRLGRPTTVLASVVILLGTTLTATAFSWREYVTVQRANGNELARLSAYDYPGARALTDHVRVPKLPMRPTVLEARSDLPETTIDGCISDFTQVALVNCTYGDRSATRTIALAGGSHAEHWITALDLLGRLHHFRVITYLKMGCPLSTDMVPLIVGANLPYPQCHDWVNTVMAKLVADRPDYVFTNSTRPRTAAHGDSTPAGYVGIWQILSDNHIGILGIRDTPWMVKDRGPFEPADCLAGGGNPTSCGVKRSDALDDRNPTLDYLAEFPLLRPLDMTEAVCRSDVCRAVEGNVLVYHDSHHLSATYVRTMADALGRQIAAATGWW